MEKQLSIPDTPRSRPETSAPPQLPHAPYAGWVMLVLSVLIHVRQDAGSTSANKKSAMKEGRIETYPASHIRLTRRINLLLIIFMSGLVLSGLTAFPLESELQIAYELVSGSLRNSALESWLWTVYEGVRLTNAEFPFMAYGTDWLAFAHLVIAVAFIGPLKDPVKNIWVVEFGLIACIAIFPFAFIAGAIREVPLYWRLVDCVFGFAGGLVLLFCYRDIHKLQNLNKTL